MDSISKVRRFRGSFMRWKYRSGLDRARWNQFKKRPVDLHFQFSFPFFECGQLTLHSPASFAVTVSSGQAMNYAHKTLRRAPAYCGSNYTGASKQK